MNSKDRGMSSAYPLFSLREGHHWIDQSEPDAVIYSP